MNHSILFAITKTNELLKIRTFKNPWLFTPLVFGYLCVKYVDKYRFDDYNDLEKKAATRNIIDAPDLIAAGLAGMKIFKISDIPSIIKNLDIFASRYNEVNDEELTCWIEIKEELLNLYKGPGDKSFFVFKSTNQDDNVISWTEEKDGHHFMKNELLKETMPAEVMTFNSEGKVVWFPFKCYKD